MNITDRQLNILSQALKLRDEGKTENEILALFPEEQQELRDLFLTMNELQTGRQAVMPSRALLTRVLADIPKQENVIQKAPSFISHYFKILLPSAMVLALLAIVILTPAGKKTWRQNLGPLSGNQANIDEISNALIQDSTSEAAIASQNMSDPALAAQENQAAQDFTNIVDPNELQ